MTDAWPNEHVELIETHISWVIISSGKVYKIKKPVHYSFLDFSSTEKRKYYCDREVELNRRFSNGVYLGVEPIKEATERFVIGEQYSGDIIDHVVVMTKLDREKQMDRLLVKNKVSPNDIERLAQKIAAFHRSAVIIDRKDHLDIKEKFNDLIFQKAFLNQSLQNNAGSIIEEAIKFSDDFLNNNSKNLQNRFQIGYCKDGHGDLHTRNIFLLPEPLPFDCIEFNDDFRQIDVLNDIAFLCMDLDAFGRHDLSDLFFEKYNQSFAAAVTVTDHDLFVYYKCYRANIRAKVNSLRAQSAETQEVKKIALTEAAKYLELMQGYIDQLRSGGKR